MKIIIYSQEFSNKSFAPYVPWHFSDCTSKPCYSTHDVPEGSMHNSWSWYMYTVLVMRRDCLFTVRFIDNLLIVLELLRELFFLPLLLKHHIFVLANAIYCHRLFLKRYSIDCGSAHKLSLHTAGGRGLFIINAKWNDIRENYTVSTQLVAAKTVQSDTTLEGLNRRSTTSGCHKSALSCLSSLFSSCTCLSCLF